MNIKEKLLSLIDLQSAITTLVQYKNYSNEEYHQLDQRRHNLIAEIEAEFERLSEFEEVPYSPPEPMPDISVNTKDLPFGATLEFWILESGDRLPDDANQIGWTCHLKEEAVVVLRINNGGSRD